ncbi:MAG: sulfurtransferase [Saprospiraceae bacterium]
MNNINIPVPLVSIEWLVNHLNHPNLVILDATKTKVGQKELSEEAKTKRIPRARNFDLQNTFKDQEATLPNTMPSPKYFEQEVQKIGINNNSVIVIYDHHGVYSSPRAWWIFKAMGHQKVAVLDGGFSAWKNANLPIAIQAEYDGNLGNFESNYQASLIKSADEVLATLHNNKVVILDARSNGRFHGTAPEPRAHLKGGHIPGSQNLPSSQIIKDGKLLPKAELKKIYDAFHLDDKAIIFTCGSGMTACVIALGAEVAGHDSKAIFDGSWTEWGDGDYPVET